MPDGVEEGLDEEGIGSFRRSIPKGHRARRRSSYVSNVSQHTAFSSAGLAGGVHFSQTNDYDDAEAERMGGDFEIRSTGSRSSVVNTRKPLSRSASKWALSAKANVMEMAGKLFDSGASVPSSPNDDKRKSALAFMGNHKSFRAKNQSTISRKAQDIADSPYYETLFQSNDRSALSRDEVDSWWKYFSVEAENQANCFTNAEALGSALNLFGDYDDDLVDRVWPFLSVLSIPNFIMVTLKTDVHYELVREVLDEQITDPRNALMAKDPLDHQSYSSKLDMGRIRSGEVEQFEDMKQSPQEHQDLVKSRVRFPKFLDIMLELKRRQESEKKTKLFPIDENSVHKQSWDFLVMMCLLYTCFSVPYMLAFETDDITEWTPFTIFDFSLDIVFCIDVGLSFVTTYVHAGASVSDMRLIAEHYLKTWFVMDIVGSFPIDKIIVWTASKDEGSPDLSSLRLLKVVRMLKLLRAVRLMVFLEKVQAREGFQTLKKAIQVAKCVFIMIFMAHIIGCLFTMMIVDPNDNWLVAYNPAAVDEPNVKRYLIALYWSIITITTMGYGDVLPVTNDERIFVIFVSIVGAVVFSYTMGTLTQLVTSASNANMKFDTQLQSSAQWLERRKVSPLVKLKVQHYLHASVRNGPQLFNENAHLNSISFNLRRQIFMDLSSHSSHLDHLVLLEGLKPEVRGAIISKLTFQVIPSGDTAYRALDPGGCIFALVSGKVVKFESENLLEDLLTPIDHEHETIVVAGESFGENGFFTDICSYRAETVLALTYSEVAVLSQQDITLLANDYPEIEIKLRRMCQLQSVWTGWNEETAELELAKFSSMKRQKGNNTEWTVQQTALNISQTVRMMKVSAAQENQKWSGDDFTAFHAWTRMSSQEVERARLDPNQAPLGEYAFRFPGEMWEYGTFVLTKDGRLYHMSDTLWGIVNDFQYLGRMLPGAGLKILQETSTEHLNMQTNWGRAASAASVASEEGDRTCHEDLKLSMDIGAHSLGFDSLGVHNGDFSLRASQDNGESRNEKPMRQMSFSRSSLICHVSLVEVPRGGLKGQTLYIGGETPDYLLGLQKQIEDLGIQPPVAHNRPRVGSVTQQTSGEAGKRPGEASVRQQTEWGEPTPIEPTDVKLSGNGASDGLERKLSTSSGDIRAISSTGTLDPLVALAETQTRRTTITTLLEPPKPSSLMEPGHNSQALRPGTPSSNVPSTATDGTEAHHHPTSPVGATKALNLLRGWGASPQQAEVLRLVGAATGHSSAARVNKTHSGENSRLNSRTSPSDTEFGRAGSLGGVSSASEEFGPNNPANPVLNPNVDSCERKEMRRRMNLLESKIDLVMLKLDSIFH